jgi:hypothetical protein
MWHKLSLGEGIQVCSDEGGNHFYIGDNKKGVKNENF